ncbi:hypothetical protein ACOSP7_010395 [Xanthoceras sorbifolium]|uniref:Uncharacterized protein n=1 Tax=Xanthoceras sorbifolium TaxID=99658 RepID=A0ABQ8HTB8_9ROSI|nr:hypothetical protein JRO89_XS07G0104100 [Xanthoceras sorbifolium]
MFRMEKKHEIEWGKAQKVVISEDLVAAAKQQLRFLAEVDKNRYLYDGPILDRAINRYKNCWLPLLAKYTKSKVTEGPLVVPLDCEWVWHCHRLNPVRYKADCEEFYGKILGGQDVVSSVQGVSKNQTAEIWKVMYTNEPYELDMSTHFSDKVAKHASGTPETTKYDLHSAVKRQSSFFYQVSRPHMKDDLFLEGAVARYKGFLHLIRRNMERGIRRFCVPTYDIDLIWHSHQLLPVSYSKDLVTLLGKVLEHDDTDSDKTKGKKLDTGYFETTKQWEEAFGFRYWRAGAMYRGNVPSPLKINMSQLGTSSRKVVPSNDYENLIKLPEKMFVEVMVEIVAVKNLPAGHRGSLFVTCSKKQPDAHFNTKRKLSILSETGKKEIGLFPCEPTGELVFQLMSYSPSETELSMVKVVELLGTVSISLQDFMNPISELWIEKWFQLQPNSGVFGSKPINLCIAVSFTSPIPAPYGLQLAPPGRFRQAKGWTYVIDEAGNEVIKIQMRDSTNAEARNISLARKEVIGKTPSGETGVLAEFSGAGWSLMNSNWLFQLQEKFSKTEDIYELTGSRKVIIFPGRKLEFELNNCANQKFEQDFMTIVEFSEENPCGKAVALLNLKSGSLKINEKWLLLPGILLAFLLCYDGSLREKGYIICETVMMGGTVNGVGEVTEDQNKEGYFGENEHKNMVKSVSLGECGSCVNGSGFQSILNKTPTNSNEAVGGDGNEDGCVGNYDYKNKAKSTFDAPKCRAPCMYSYGLQAKTTSDTPNCGAPCMILPTSIIPNDTMSYTNKEVGGDGYGEGCVENNEHGKMVESSGCYGPCGGSGGCRSVDCSSCSNCGGECGGEAVNDTPANEAVAA